MAKILVRATVSQLIYVDPADYGQRDDLVDLDDMAETDLNNATEGFLILDDLFDVNATTFKLTYEEA